MSELTVISCNMHMGVPAGMELEPANERREAVADIASFLVDAGCDIALLQEVRNDAPGVRPGGVARQYELLTSLTAAQGAAFHPTIASGAGDEYGLCILTRRGVELTRVEVVPLPHSDLREPRVMLAAQAVVDGEPVVVVDLHLDFTSDDRHAQLLEAERVLCALLEHRDVEIAAGGGARRSLAGLRGPLLVGGDFNDAAEAVAIAMARTQLVNIVDGLVHDDPLRAPTHPHGGRIDHLLLGPGLELRAQELVEVPRRELREGDSVTDHLAIVARVALEPGAASRAEAADAPVGATYAVPTPPDAVPVTPDAVPARS